MSLLVALGCAGCWPFDPSLVPRDGAMPLDARDDGQAPADARLDAPDATSPRTCVSGGGGAVVFSSRALASAGRTIGDVAMIDSGRADGSHDLVIVDRVEPFGALAAGALSRTLPGARCSEEDAPIEAPWSGVVATSGTDQLVASVLPLARSGTALDYVLSRSGGAGVVLWRAAAGYVDRDLARDPLPGTDVAVGDLNEDGRLDLVSFGGALGSPLRVVLGQPSGWLDSTPIEDAIGVGRAWLLDVDRDGHLDLVTAPETDPTVFPQSGWEGHTPALSALYLGDGTGALVRSAASNLSNMLAPHGSAVLADLDDDGWLDIFQIACGWDPGDATRLPATVSVASCDAVRLMNDGTGRFVPFTQRVSEIGVRRVGSRAPAVASDLDLDGHIDVVLALDQLMVLHSEPVTLEDWRFVQASEGALGLDSLELGEEPRVVVGDLDAEGADDVVVVDRQPGGLARLMMSHADSHRVSVRLRGRAGNPDAIGAELCLYRTEDLPAGPECTGPMVTHRHRFATTTQPQAPLILFGLVTDVAYTLRVRWPHVEGSSDEPTDIAVSSAGPRVVEVTAP